MESEGCWHVTGASLNRRQPLFQAIYTPTCPGIMHSRRRSRRSPRLIKYNSLSSRTTPARQRKMIKRPKFRLIRRYIIANKVDKVDPYTNVKQPSLLDLHATGRVSRPTRNAGKLFGYGPHDVVTDKKVPIKQPAEINTIPNPIPDTGPVAFGSIAPGSPLLGAIRDTSTFGLIIPPTPPPSLPLPITPPGSFSALPPLPIPSVTSAILVDTDLRLPSPSSAVETSLPKSPNVNPQITASKTHSVNLAVIILLAVGSALLLLGSCVLVKICTRTRRKELPKPSLPIFEDADPEADFFETKESPIFGGKERLSPMPEPTGAGGPAWTWIQYPHARLTQSVASAQRNSNGGPHTSSHPIQSELGHIPADTPNESAVVVPTTSLHTLRRQSIYSPRSCANIAQAITHDRLTTANGDEILTQSRSRTSPKRRSQLVSDEKQRHRESAASTIGLAYDGDYVASPSVVEYTPVDTPVIGHREGRERIKSSYFATGSYPTASNTHGTAYSIATATRVNVGQRNSFSKDKFTLQNSNSKWQRDTQALTYALGLATPETNYLAQSPQPTLYPDDSMSVVDIKTRNPSYRKPPDIPVIIPDDKPPRNSGLMNMDFRVSQMSLSEMTVEDGRISPPTSEHGHPTDRPMPRAQSSNTGLTKSSYSAGMPPRVPSPPPLPSLSQMALAQHNPEAYANYRSPTYSLYGLYESPDRKSIIR